MDALPAVVAERLDEVRALCEKYYVRKLTIFGSAVKGTFDPTKSDLDFVVELDEDPTKTDYSGRTSRCAARRSEGSVRTRSRRRGASRDREPIFSAGSCAYRAAGL